MSIEGILLLDKPLNMTSNAALQKVKRLFNAKKAGHTGSLDPLATGMLPICFGEATKFSQYLLNSDKKYYVVAKLGETTNTGDAEGIVVETKPVANLSLEKITGVCEKFLGEQLQIPPMFSAIKINGKPLYKLARQGIEVKREPRNINVFSLTLEYWHEDKIALQIHCSKGTYIRTLIEDIGEALGCGAHVSELRRLLVSPYENKKMYALSTLEELAQQKGNAGLSSTLLTVETAVEAFPAVKIPAASAFYLRMGQSIRMSFALDSPLVRLLSENGRFLGMGEITQDGRIKPHRLIATN